MSILCNSNYIESNGFYDNRNKWNSLTVINNKLYRHRVETLVIKERRYIFLRIRNIDNLYNVPGGSIECGIPNITQAVNEVNEEARIDLNNISYSNITYIENYKTLPIQMRDENYPVKYTGKFNEIYIADFKGRYTGEVLDVDADKYMTKDGRFYLIKEVASILKAPHIKALERFKLL